MERNVVGNIISVGGVRACKKCGRPFRFLSISGATPLLAEAADGNSLGVRIVQHDCTQSAENVKALRSTISHCKQIIGRTTQCPHCKDLCRRVYRFKDDVWTWVNDPGFTSEELMSYNGPLVEHTCDRGDS